MEPAIMLFDEATSALDPELVGEVLLAMRRLAQEGTTMLVVTHELGFAYNVAQRVIYLHEGTIHEEGTPEQVLVNPSKPRTRDFLRGVTTFRMPEPKLGPGNEANRGEGT
jgi:polar amino acid transport system ATP-binding protein